MLIAELVIAGASYHNAEINNIISHSEYREVDQLILIVILDMWDYRISHADVRNFTYYFCRLLAVRNFSHCSEGRMVVVR